MTKLTSKARKKLRKSAFALPGGRFPVEDKAHTRDAKARASQSYNAGKLSAADKAKVDRKADTVPELRATCRERHRYGKRPASAFAPSSSRAAALMKL